MNKIINDIAKQILGIETLETRNSDSLDFHEVSVWQLRNAFDQVYKAGSKRENADLKLKNVQLQSGLTSASEKCNKLEDQIEQMKKDLIELRSESFDAGMYLKVDELCRKWNVE